MILLYFSDILRGQGSLPLIVLDMHASEELEV